MKIVVFADVHYFAGDISTAIFNTKKKLVRYALPLLNAIKEKGKADGDVDFYVNLGDVIQDTTEHDGDIRALSFMFGKLNEFCAPCHSVLGNHDLKLMGSVDEVEALLGHRSTYSYNKNGWHFVFLTTEVRCELGTERGGCYKAQYIANKTLQWLKNDLAKNSDPCLIFTHYGLAEDPDINDECMFMKNRADVKAILEKDSNVKAVFCGHQHKTKVHTENGIRYYHLGSLIGCDEGNDIPDAVYFEVFLDGENVTVHEKKADIGIKEQKEKGI